MMMQVDGIGSLKQYRRVLDYLSGVHGISAVTADRVTPSNVRFQVKTDGGIDAVMQTIALGDVLEKVDQPIMESAPVVTLPKQSESSGQAQGAADSQGGDTPAATDTESGDESAATPQAAPVQPAISVLHYRLAP